MLMGYLVGVDVIWNRLSKVSMPVVGLALNEVVI
jgi:hypothetical protein